MLKVLHHHIFASKLRDVFGASPLVLVYQTVGSVDVAATAASLQAGTFSFLLAMSSLPACCIACYSARVTTQSTKQ